MNVKWLKDILENLIFSPENQRDLIGKRDRGI
jgi:hypothetical protein